MDKMFKGLASMKSFQGSAQWISCAERLPTEADEDFDRVAWAITNTGLIERVQASVVRIPFESFSYTHWMPTGLTRPQPPEGV